MKIARLSFLFAASLAAASLAPGCAARVSVPGPVPPAYVDAAPPDLVVLPGTDIYAAPSFEAGLYFVDGWWWRPWNGRWYRSRQYGSGWDYYTGTPYFYSSVPRDWRSEYYRHEWRGRPWQYHHVSRDEAVTHWDRWKQERRWTDERNGYHGDRDTAHGDMQRRDGHGDTRRETGRYDQHRDMERGGPSPGAHYERRDRTRQVEHRSTGTRTMQPVHRSEPVHRIPHEPVRTQQPTRTQQPVRTRQPQHRTPQPAARQPGVRTPQPAVRTPQPAVHGHGGATDYDRQH